MAGALRAVERADVNRRAADVARRAATIAQDIAPSAAVGLATGGATLLALTYGPRAVSGAVSGLKTHLAERAAAKRRAADAAEQLVAAGMSAEAKEAARAAEEREWADNAEAERASAPDRIKKAIEVAEANEKREEEARTTALERRTKNDAKVLVDSQTAARTKEGAIAYIERVTRRRAKIANCTQTRITAVDGAELIHDGRGSVGALLYRNGAYVGFSVPVITREIHTTRLAYCAASGDSYDAYDLFTATDEQCAGVKFDRTAPAYTSSRALSRKFLMAMFLDDVFVLSGNTTQDSMKCFFECAQRMANSGLSRVFDWRGGDAGPSDLDDDCRCA